MAKPPEYRLSAPNTGSYRLSPQAAPVSTYVRPSQLNPNLTDYKAQVDSFQDFVKSMADWRVSENVDNQERAQLRALADNARGELDANLENEDEDYQKYGRFLQGKNYGKEIGTKLVAEITTGSEGQMGLMDQAFAQSKLPENHNRKVEDIFSELLEDRKDFYRDQVPDSSDEFYSGFGEAMQPFASSINKSFYEKIQKETFNGRRENFSQSLRLQLETDILAVSRGEKDIKFNQEYLRNLSASFSSVAGLSEDAALGESIRILNSEIGQIIENADSEEDLEVAEKMLSIFDTVIKSKPGVKGRALLIDIPIFKEDAQRAYTSLGGAIESQRKIIEAKEEKDKEDRIDDQALAVTKFIINNDGKVKLTDFEGLGPDLKDEDLRVAFNFANTLKDRNKKDQLDSNVFGQALVKAKQGILTYNDALTLLGANQITKADFNTLTTSISGSKKFTPGVFNLFLDDISNSLKQIPPTQTDILKLKNPQGLSTAKKYEIELQAVIIEEAQNLLESNTENLDVSRQIELIRQARESPRVKAAIEKYDNHITNIIGGTEKPDEEEEVVTREQQLDQRYLSNEDSWETLYEDYYSYFLKNRANAPLTLDDDNLFKGLGTQEAKSLFNQLLNNDKFSRPSIDGKVYSFNTWAKDEIFEEMESLMPISQGMEDALRSLLKLVAPDAKMPLKPSEKLGKKLKPILGRNFKEEEEDKDDPLGWLLGPKGKEVLGVE